MHLDPRTIVFIIIISTFLMSISLLSVWKVYFSRINSVRHWAAAILIQSAGWTLISFKGHIPDFPGIVVSNILILLALAVFFNVLAKFNNFKISPVWAYLPVGLDGALLYYFTFIHRDYTARVIAQAGCSALLLFASSYIVLSKRSGRPTSHVFTGVVFGLSGVILLARIFFFISTHASQNVFAFAPLLLQDVSYMSFYVMAVMLNFGFILMCNDWYVQENNKTEDLLLKSEERYRNIVETAQEGIWLLDKNYQTVFVNKKMAEILEYTAGEMIGKNTLYFMAEEDRVRAVEAMKRKKNGISEIMELRFRTKSGKNIWTSMSTSAIFLNNGNFSGALAMVTDITESFEASEALKYSENQLKEAQKIASVGSYNYNFKTGVWKCSKTVDEISGLSESEIRHFENWTALLAPEYKDEYAKEIRDTIELGIGVPGRFRDYKIIQAHTGEEKWVSIKAEVEYDGSGNPVNMFGTVQDITDRKKEEGELKDLNTQLRHLSSHLQTIREEERAHISREIHDELGQQLTVLKMDIYSLKNKMEPTSPFVEKANQMIRMADESIRTIKRIATELRPGLLDDLGLVAALEWNAKEFQKRTGIKCNFRSTFTTDNFSREINTTVFRIFQESLTNVVRHSKADAVDAKLHGDDHMLVLEVNDNGIGISNEGKNKKSSLGLLGMKERAIILHGDFSINEIKEGGTCVTLKIPLS